MKKIASFLVAIFVLHLNVAFTHAICDFGREAAKEFTYVDSLSQTTPQERSAVIKKETLRNKRLQPNLRVNYAGSNYFVIVINFLKRLPK